MKIYVASSWRNPLQPEIVTALRRCGHEVYDFHHPAPGNTGFHWTEVDPDWSFEGRGVVEPERYRKMLQHPIAMAGYERDITALLGCDAVVYVLPCGRSASWEFGYAMGQGKLGYVVQFEPQEPELMFSEAIILTSMSELFEAFGTPPPGIITAAERVALSRLALGGEPSEPGIAGKASDILKSVDAGILPPPKAIEWFVQRFRGGGG